MKLIDKDKVVAEIERIMNEQQEICKADVAHGNDYPDPKNVEVIYQFQQFIKFLDSLEVKDVEGEELDKLLDWWKERTTEHSCQHVKEVDLEKEIDFYIETSVTGANPIYTKGAVSNLIERTAKHFFELGLKAKKGE